MHWRRKWQHTPVFLPGESQGNGRREGEGPRKGSGALSHAKKFWGFLWALENHKKFLRRVAICSGKPCGRKFQK